LKYLEEEILVLINDFQGWHVFSETAKPSG